MIYGLLNKIPIYFSSISHFLTDQSGAGREKSHIFKLSPPPMDGTSYTEISFLAYSLKNCLLIIDARGQRAQRQEIRGPYK